MLDRVREFHLHHRYPTRVNLRLSMMQDSKETYSELHALKVALKILSSNTKQLGVDAAKRGDSRLYRMHLMMEELSEVVEALTNGDETALAHELTDLLYVVVGSFDTYDFPMEALFTEVHKANMTKERKTSDYRMNNKGDHYIPPDIKSVLSKDCRA